MTEREFYTRIGGDYDEALKRMMNDALIKRFVLKFKDDKCYSELKKALDEENWDNAFSAAHTMKGVVLNLSFKRLSEKLISLTDALREQNRMSLEKAVIEELFADVRCEYETVITEIVNLANC